MSLSEVAPTLRRIGGSDIPKLLGISKYGSALDVYQRIVEGVEDEWNPRMERGAAVEPQLRAYAQNRLELELEEAPSDYHVHPDLEFAWAQVDDVARLRGMPVCVDYKSVNRWMKGWGADGSDVVPETIRAQLAWEMLCTDRPLGLLVVGFGDDVPGPEIFSLSNVVSYQVERCPHFESYCVAVAREFWETCVVPRRPPPVKALGKKKAVKS